MLQVELVQSDPHELQGVGVHDVEAAASVHEHFGEAGVADDGVDNERVPSRARITLPAIQHLSVSSGNANRLKIGEKSPKPIGKGTQIQKNKN